MANGEQLPTDPPGSLPASIIEVMEDLTRACTATATAVDQAFLLERSAADDHETALRHTSPFQASTAHAIATCAVTFAEQLLAAYAGVAATYAAFTARLAVDAVAGRPINASPTPVLPSVVLRRPIDAVPLVQLLADPPNESEISATNAMLIAHHRALAAAVARALRSHPADVYDDPAAIAHRRGTDVDLHRDFPETLHAYAEACASAISHIQVGALQR